MAEKTQQTYPLAPENENPRSTDEELISSKELRRKRRIRCAVYIVAFVIFQTAIILAFVLTVMRVKNPKLRVGELTVNTFETSNTAGVNASASFDVKFVAQVRVKNTNFGHYKFDNTTMSFLYDGVTVGQATIPKARARARSTKKMDITVEVNSRALPSTTRVGSELSSSVLTLHSQAKMKGKVEVMKVLVKKNKYAEMNCTIVFNVSTKSLQDLKCK